MSTYNRVVCDKKKLSIVSFCGGFALSDTQWLYLLFRVHVTSTIVCTGCNYFNKSGKFKPVTDSARATRSRLTDVMSFHGNLKV